MRYADFHVHTRFCDGANTVREMVESAIEKGLSAIGFSAHSYTFFDESYCMKKEQTEQYKAEVLACKEEYRDKIRVLLGIEQDLYSDMPTDGYDYVIGSVHYLKKDGAYYSVDSSAEGFQKWQKKSSAVTFMHFVRHILTRFPKLPPSFILLLLVTLTSYVNLTKNTDFLTKRTSAMLLPGRRRWMRFSSPAFPLR